MTTTATGSPTKRTTSLASSGWFIWSLIRPGIMGGSAGRSAMSAPVKYGDHAGGPSGRAGIDRVDPRVRHGGPDEEDVARAGQPLVLHVVGVDRAAGQEAGVFGPHDPGSQNAHTHRSLCAIRFPARQDGRLSAGTGTLNWQLTP